MPVQLLTFPFDRTGGGFVIEAAIATNRPFYSRWGRTIASKQLNTHDLDVRCRIHPNGIFDNSRTDDGFHYDMRTL